MLLVNSSFFADASAAILPPAATEYSGIPAEGKAVSLPHTQKRPFLPNRRNFLLVLPLFGMTITIMYFFVYFITGKKVPYSAAQRQKNYDIITFSRLSPHLSCGRKIVIFYARP